MKLYLRYYPGLRETAALAWERLPAEHPLAGAQVVLQEDDSVLDGSVAEAKLCTSRSGVSGVIRVGQLFGELPACHRPLTLLHESIHLGMHLGPCAPRVTRAEKIERKYSQFKGASQDEWNFEIQQIALARLLYFFPEAVIAEKRLQVAYPELATGRLEQYAAIQDRLWRTGEHTKARPELTAPNLLVRLLYNRLGASLCAPDDGQRVPFAERIDALTAALRETVSAAEFDWLIAMSDRLMSASSDGTSWDEDAANALFEWVVNVPYRKGEQECDHGR
jgi:hypothetical protein